MARAGLCTEHVPGSIFIRCPTERSACGQPRPADPAGNPLGYVAPSRPWEKSTCKELAKEGLSLAAARPKAEVAEERAFASACFAPECRAAWPRFLERPEDRNPVQPGPAVPGVLGSEGPRGPVTRPGKQDGRVALSGLWGREQTRAAWPGPVLPRRRARLSRRVRGQGLREEPRPGQGRLRAWAVGAPGSQDQPCQGSGAGRSPRGHIRPAPARGSISPVQTVSKLSVKVPPSLT